ncbi:MAG: CD0415/CD1112 family protein [Defluviitaleaceae bacterium]|nr:CD0415/CD1112 family protein [Defluviitaleaceae bacterium]
MLWLRDFIDEWFRELMIDGIVSNFTSMFDDLNVRVNDIASQVGETPSGWNSSIFNMVRTISETVIIPIAGVILTFILCYELIQMILEKNNMAEFDTFNIYKWVFKTFCAVLILTNTFDIVVGVFEIAQHVVNSSAGVIVGSLDVDIAIADLEEQLEDMGTGALVQFYIESSILQLAIRVISICVFLIIYGRMIEIYLTISLAPIPLATLVNREWGNTGNSYLKSLFALAFQGFLIMVCVAIYAVLLSTITTADSVHAAAWGTVSYTILLAFTLFRTSGLAKSIFGSG